MTKNLSRAAGRYGALKKTHSPDDPAVLDALSDFVTVRLCEHVEDELAKAPSLSRAQLDRIVAVINGSEI